eukprot:1158317-Pelagomonas_calceolata.AAC.7
MHTRTHTCTHTHTRTHTYTPALGPWRAAAACFLPHLAQYPPHPLRPRPLVAAAAAAAGHWHEVLWPPIP